MATPSQELKAQVTSLTSFLNKPEAVDQVITILEALKGGAPPSEENLRATKAGFYIGKLRSHGNNDVRRLATEIVHKWKKAVELEKKKTGAPTNKPVALTATPPANSPVPTPSAKFTGDPERRKYTTDGVSIKVTGDDSRDNCIGLLYNGLAYHSYEPSEVVKAKAVEVELAAFRAHSGDGTAVSDAYKKRVKTLFMNMKNKQQAGNLGKRVMAGDITADSFVRMDEKQLKSDELKKLEKSLEEENMKKAQVPMAEKSISTALECGKCKKKKVSYSQAQTRSADEPMTTFCECLNCGNRWKFS